MRLKRNVYLQQRASFHWPIFHLTDCFGSSCERGLSSYLFQSIFFATLFIHSVLEFFPPQIFPTFLSANVLGVEDALVLSGLAVCILHIASSQRLESSKQNNEHRSGLSSECQDCLVLGSRQNVRGTSPTSAEKTGGQTGGQCAKLGIHAIIHNCH